MSKRKSTSQSSQTSSSTSTPINPDWVQSTAQGLNAGIQRVAQEQRVSQLVARRALDGLLVAHVHQQRQVRGPERRVEGLRLA